MEFELCDSARTGFFDEADWLLAADFDEAEAEASFFSFGLACELGESDKDIVTAWLGSCTKVLRDPVK